jgi:hypothetical protein
MQVSPGREKKPMALELMASSWTDFAERNFRRSMVNDGPVGHIGGKFVELTMTGRDSCFDR